MYRSLKHNFFFICLDSAFLSKSRFVKTNSSSILNSALHARRRIAFFNLAIRLRYFFVKYWRDYPFLCMRLTTSLLRKIDFIPFLRCFGLKFFSKRSPKNYSSYVRYRINNRVQGNILFTLLRNLYKRTSIKKFNNFYVNSSKSIFFSSDKTSYFFDQFFRAVGAETHIVSFYFRMMMRNFKFHLGDGRAFFFLKKLIRLSFYQLGLRLITSGIGIFLSTFKTLICGYFFCDSCSSDTSNIVHTIIIRLCNFLALDHSTFMQIITSGQLHASRVLAMHKRISTRLLLYKRRSFFFFGFILGFSRAFLRYTFYMSTRAAYFMRNTFNFFINNSSARNVFSSLNRGRTMLYGTTSGTFKLRKRIRYRKHAMFMVAAKFYRIISYYYKAKAVRSLNMNFTGYRRSFSIIFQFFRNLIRQNIKHHFTPVQVLFKFQPLLKNMSCVSSPSKSFSFFNKVLLLRLRRLKYYATLRGYRFVKTQLDKFKGTRSFFYTNGAPLLKFKNSKMVLFRQYSTVFVEYPRFIYKSPGLPKTSTPTSFYAQTVSPFSIEKPVLSVWFYSTVYKAIIRTRRQYKVHKKLIAPLIAQTQLDCFDYKLFFGYFQRSFIIPRLSSARDISSVVSRYNSFFSYNISYSRCAAITYSSKITCDFHTSSFSFKRSYRKVKYKKRLNYSKKRSKKDISFFRAKINKLSPVSYLSVFRTRMAIFLNTIFSGSTVRYRPVISHGGCYKRKRVTDRRYWF